MSRLDVDGKSVLVTGAAGGIGAAAVHALVAKGANVTLVDLRTDDIEKVTTTLPADQVLAHAADVTSYDDMVAAADAAVARFGRLDVVFANAGIARPGTLAATDLADYEQVIEVDLLGVVRTVKAALPHVIENQGHVLITASIYAFCNGVVNSPYAASKAAVESLGRSLRLELAPHGATAGVLYPGWIATPLSAVAGGEDPTVTALKDRVFKGPLGTFIEPEQVADAVVRGIESRAARIIEPKRWAALSHLRGAFNAVADAVLERDQGLLQLVKQVERRYAAVRGGDSS